MEIFNGRDAFRMKVQQAIEKELVSIPQPPVSIIQLTTLHGAMRPSEATQSVGGKWREVQESCDGPIKIAES